MIDNSSKIIKNDIRADKSAVVIWEEDFGSGFPAGWSTYTNNTGAGNTIMGYSAGQQIRMGGYNTAIGRQALQQNISYIYKHQRTGRPTTLLLQTVSTMVM